MDRQRRRRHVSVKRERKRRHRKVRARYEPIASMGKRKASTCQQGGDGDSQASKAPTSSIAELPEDIWASIHSLMPMREAARAARLSRAFLCSWRCHPNLIFNKDTIGVKRSACGGNFHQKIDRILRNHSGISLKIFNLDYSGMCGFDGTSYFDRWLQIALKPGIEELTLVLGETVRQYNFPCMLLSDGVRDSLCYLKLRFCALHPTIELGPLKSLTCLHLLSVSVTTDELERLLSNSLALEQLELTSCNEINRLKIPCSLQQLSSLSICACSRLEVIESKAPNLSSIFLEGNTINFSLVETLQMKKLSMTCTNFIRDARAKLPSIMPNLETLVVESWCEVVDAPMLPTKFLYLKHLTIRLTWGGVLTRPYDYFSLISFLDASPSLETLTLAVTEHRMVHESIFTDSQLRLIPEQRHVCLKSLDICGFTSAKCLVELTCYILKNAVSLESLTLDTVYGHRCHQGAYKSCLYMPDDVLMEAPRGLSAIRTFIENKVPSTVRLTVMEPCSRCHVTLRR